MSQLITVTDNTGALVSEQMTQRGQRPEGSRFNAVMRAINTRLKERFENVWTTAFQPEQLEDTAYEGARIAVFAAMLDPSTWCIERYLQPQLAQRAREAFKGRFVAELERLRGIPSSF